MLVSNGRDTDGNTCSCPDFVGFIAEIRQYGHGRQVGNAAKAFKQLAFEGCRGRDQGMRAL